MHIIDDVLDGIPPTIIERRGKIKVKVNLSRRRFLCYLFGYLAFICFFLFTIGLFANLVVPASPTLFLQYEWSYYVKMFFTFIYLFFLANMMIVTLLGLYYLTVRIHVTNGKIEPPK